MQRMKDDFIGSLVYPEHDSRRAMVGAPAHRTFGWVFGGPVSAPGRGKKAATWSDFPKWLREGSSLYWITAKPASGKSTLMAHTSNEPATKEHLNTWASGKPIHILRFFFWRPGSTLQKSIQGLLRALLLQTLHEACPRGTEM